MFRIESYITPIILSYVDKYVKNIRPQDAQVSLWGGEVAFQNLDLRLDVLEEELQLPFNFLSGHIHELIIHVPWTKIASEPIVITINTIEFVLKLKDVNSTASFNMKEKRKKTSKEEMIQAPPGYMASLVNKIANNISIQCHNIIFKYVEEDIVVSMNIQLLSVDSADTNWNPAFIDISPIKVLLRKIVNVTDLTICLDKRNETGKIDVCQEPILYRCSMKVRLLRRYNISTLHRSSVIRVDAHTESVDLNISSLQFPMMMRLINLVMSLKDGKIKKHFSSLASSESHADSEQNEDDGESFFTWAWNLLPSIFPSDGSDENSEEINGHVMHFGMYADKFKLTFKNQEIIQDSIVHTTKKIKYNPILRIELSGAYSDTVMIGNRWFNLKGGVSNIGIYPVGDCTCGNKQGLSSILTMISNTDNLYREDSLMDINTGENNGISSIYNMSWETHFNRNTEQSLLSKTPAMAFDIVHQIEIPDDIARSSDIGSDLEFSDLSEKYLCRLFVGPVNLKYGLGVVHLLETLQTYIDLYNYLPYVEEKPQLSLAQLSPPSTDDYDALMAEIPTRTIQLYLCNPVIEFHTNDHEKIYKVIRPKLTQQQNKIDHRSKRNLVILTLEINRLEFKMVYPTYPNRLIHTTCQLPDPPTKLLDNCYSKINIVGTDATVNLIVSSIKRQLCILPHLNCDYNRLLLPELWEDNTIYHLEGSVYIPKILITVNPPQQTFLNDTLNMILCSYLNENYTSSILSINDLLDDTLPTIEIKLENAKGKMLNTICTSVITANIHSINGLVYIPDEINILPLEQQYQKKYLIIQMNSKDFFLDFTFQQPVNIENVIHPPILLFSITELSLSIDPLFCEYLRYENKLDVSLRKETLVVKTTDQQIPESTKSEAAQTITDTPKKISISEKQTKITPKNLETVHSSSDRNAPIISPKREIERKQQKRDIFFYYLLCKRLIVFGDIKSCFVYIPAKSLINLSPSEITNTDTIVFRFPFLTLNSTGNRQLLPNPVQSLPIKVSNTLWDKDKDWFPWTMCLSEISCYTIQNNIRYNFLKPLKTDVTLAVTYKKENEENMEKANIPFAVVLHVDTVPVIINFSEKQIYFLYLSIRNLLTLPIFAQYLKSTEKCGKNLEIAQRPISPDSNIDLKQFLGMKTTSTYEVSSEDTEILREENPMKISLWLQWTFTKITLKFYGLDQDVEKKFVIDFEDIISSIDIRDIYIKLKNKIGSFNGQYFIREKKIDSWKKSEQLGICTRGSDITDLSDTFFDLTITKAETGNVHSKWGTYKKNRNLNDNLAEIMINMQHIDFKIDLDVLSSFISIFSIIYLEKSSNYKENVSQNSVTGVIDLPLIYFQSKGFRFFIPINNSINDCNVYILKIGSISITPVVDNPLSRTPVRPDIYTKAAQLRILSIPGSKIEDRQYELAFKSITLGTGNWEEVMSFMENSVQGSIVYNENPAFVWNNQAKKTNVDISAILKDFNFSIIYAPCIIFKNILVCGEGVELNCLTDLILNLTTNQLIVAQLLLKKYNVIAEILMTSNSTKLKKAAKSLAGSETVKKIESYETISNINYSLSDIKANKSFDTLVHINEFNKRMNKIKRQMDKLENDNKISDSGIGSIEIEKKTSNNITMMSLAEKQSINSNQQVVIPSDISFVGGIFTLNLYHNFKETNAKEPGKSFNVRFPLCSISLFQPNLLFTCGIYEKTLQMSLFNLGIALGSDQMNLQKTKEEFGDTIFHTNQGKLDNLGIPPSIFRMKFHKNISNENELNIILNRPMKLDISDRSLKKIFAIRMILNDSFTQDKIQDDFIVSGISTKTANIIKLIRSYMFGSNCLKLTMARLTLTCSKDDKYDVSVILSNIDLKMKVLDRPERVLLDFKLKDLSIKTKQYVLLHPCAFNFKINIMKEIWQRTPLLSITASSNFIQIDLGPGNILNIMEIKKSFLTSVETFSQQLTKSSSPIAEQRKLNSTLQNLTLIPTPKPQTNNSIKFSDEHYQDDLRAGAFQFIELSTEENLPLPYQIQIINKEVGIVCWKYPQPRALSRVEIFPVPFPTLTPVKIRCSMEYYSELHSQFQPYCEFNLSENETKILDLPKRKVTASIWRVVMSSPMISVDGTYFEEESSSTDEDNFNDNRDQFIYQINDILQKIDMNLSDHNNPDQKFKGTVFNMHPKVLVACMRIDSFFSPTLIPNLKGFLDIKQFEVNLVNHIHNKMVMIPKVIKECTPAKNIIHCQAILTGKIDDIKVQGNIYDDMQISVDTNLRLECSMADYSYLTMQPVIENFQFSSFIESGTDTTNINIVTDNIHLRYGPTISHTILTSYSLWEQMFSDDPIEMVIMSRFIICNQTNVPFKFGQLQTDESIIIKPKICHMYVFRSDKKDQKLFFSHEHCDQSSVIQSCNIGLEGTQFLKMESDSILLIKTEKISTTQRKITMKGQIEFINMSVEAFKVQFRTVDNDSSNIDLKLDGKSSGSIFKACQPNKNYTIRIRFIHELERTGWSGEIPLRPTGKNLPWLVKVPTYTKSEYVSFWIKIIREDIQDIHALDNNIKHQRILVIFWPLFILKSMLAINSTIYEQSSDKTYSLTGRGSTKELNLPGTHEDDHNLQFDTKFLSPSGEDKRNVLLSYKTINKNIFFANYNPSQSINAIIEDLEKISTNVNWPCSREEELRWNREIKNQNTTSPIYKFSPSHNLSCSLMLEVAPWCTFINSTEYSVVLSSLNEEQYCTIQSNNISMPLGVLDVFTVGIKVEENWIKSHPIYINTSGKKISPSYTINEEGFVNIDINSQNGTSKLLLTSIKENGMKIIILSSYFVISNFTKYNLKIWAFSVQSQEKKTLIKPNDIKELGNYDIPKQTHEPTQYPKGVALTSFFDLTSKKKRLKDPKAYNYFIAIRYSSDSEFSCPIFLNEAVNRKCFSMPFDNVYIPLSISIIKYQEQNYISIYEDKYPELYIENLTDVSLYVAQSETINSNKPTVAVKECFDTHFDWYQIVPPKTAIWYTPPSVDKIFPEILTTIYGLVFAVVTSGNSIKWSLPVQINETKDVFLTIPLRGDLKISMNTKYSITRLVINYISQNLEFSARDIRSRLLNPNKSTSHNSDNESLPLISHDESKTIDQPYLLNRNINETPEKKNTINWNIFMKEVNFVLYTDVETNNYLKTELVSLSLDEISVCVDNVMKSIQIGIGNIQIDNQLYSSGEYDFPVFLCAEEPTQRISQLPSPLALEKTFQFLKDPLCNITLQFYENEMILESLQCRLKPVRIYLEDTYVNRLMDFLVECVPTKLVYSPEQTTRRETCAKGMVLLPKIVMDQSLLLSEPLKLKFIKIETLNVLLSIHSCVRLYVALDHSPLTFSTFEKKNINTLSMKLGYSLGMHYLSGAIFGAGWVVGSLEILGSPSGLARSVSNGLRDFVSLPVQGLFRGPWDFLVGVTYGSASLVKNITTGTLNSVTKLATSVARNLDRLTLDDEHLQRTDALRRYRPQCVSQGVAQGLTDFGITLLGAVGGIARHTLEARSATQIVTGVGKGLMGVILKPISGAAELVALAGQGVLQSVGYNALPSCRLISIISNTSMGPATSKFGWKLLPHVFANDPILFASHATMMKSKTELVAVMIALSANILSILDLTTDELSEIITIDKIHPDVDVNDSTVVILKIQNTITTEGDDQSINQLPVINRVREYVQSSREQLPTYSNSSSELAANVDENILEATSQNGQVISFYIHSNRGEHLVSYINFIKNGNDRT